MRFIDGMFKRSLAALALAAAVLSGGSIQAQAPAGPNQRPGPMRQQASAATMHAPEYVAPRPLETLVGRSRHGDLTVRDLFEFARTGQYQLITNLVPIPKIPALPLDMMRDAARQVAASQEAAQAVAKSTDTQLKLDCSANLPALKSRIFVTQVFNTEVMDKITSPTEAQIQAFYEKHKPELKQPFQFKIRFLLLLTYERYVVKDASETLESIAQRVSGDPAQAANIRADVESRPLRREEGKLFKALTPGEKLLVPMSKERQQEVRQQLEAILTQLKQGKSFEELARKYSEAETRGEEVGPLPTGTRQGEKPLTQLVEMAKATPVGQISPIFQTKHGFQVIQVTQKVEEGFIPLQTAREQIVTAIKEEQKNELIQVALKRLFSTSKIKIDFAQIAKGDKLTTETAIASLGNGRVLWNDFKAVWEENGSPVEPDAIMVLVKQSYPFLALVSQEYLQPQLQDPTTTLSRQLARLETAYVGQAYIGRTAAQRVIDKITTGSAKAYYDRYKDTKFLKPPHVEYALMVMPLKPEQSGLSGPAREQALAELSKKMAGQLSKVKKVEDFQDLVAQHELSAPRPENAPVDTAEPTPLERVPEGIMQQLAKIQPGQWTQPFVFENSMVVSALLRSRSAAQPVAFEEVVDEINRQLFGEAFEATYRQVIDEFAKRANFEFLLKS